MMNTDACANCGKTGEDGTKLKSCKACHLVKYCGIECQRAHRPRHKKECRRRAAELKDEALFGRGHEYYAGKYPICFLPMPLDETQGAHRARCPKVTRLGCAYKSRLVDGKNARAFCRAPTMPESRMGAPHRKKAGAGDAFAKYPLAPARSDGSSGTPRDRARATEPFEEAAELGRLSAIFKIGTAYWEGADVPRDKKRAVGYWERAAMAGNGEARHNLGWWEEINGRMDRALRHFMISAKMGDNDSIAAIGSVHRSGLATREQCAEALLGYRDAAYERRSDQRDEAKDVDSMHVVPGRGAWVV